MIKEEEKLHKACEATLLKDPGSLHFSHLVLPDIALKITCVINHGSNSCVIGLPAAVKESLQSLEVSRPLALGQIQTSAIQDRFLFVIHVLIC